MPDAGTEADDARPESDESRPDADGARSLLLGAFRHAFADTDSALLRSYVVVSALLGALVGVLVVLALPVWILNTVGGSVLATFSRAFLLVGGVILLVALVVPVVVAGRRHARAAANAGARETTSARADDLLALSGYLFVLSLYLSLLISAPPGQRETPPALLAPVVEFLYGLPAVLAVAPPLLAMALMGLVHLLTR